MPTDPVIESAELSAIGAFRLVDVRDSEAFASGHAAHAVRVPIERWEAAAKDDATSLNNVTYWQSEIGVLGVDNETPAII